MGKKVAQVATQYAIYDLPEEAVAQDIMPLSPLVVPADPVNTVYHALATLQSSARYLSRVASKSLLA